MARYTQDAIEICAELYLRFNGNAERVEKEMRREWPTWSKSRLYDSGKKGTPKFREGWVSKYGWKNRLTMSVLLSGQRAATSAEVLFLEIETHRRALSQQIQKLGKKADRDLVYQHRDYCRLSIEALARLEAARNNLAGFKKSFEDLLKWLPSISQKAYKEFLKVSEQIIERAKSEYVSSEK